MKPQNLAVLLNISAPTLRRWAGKEFAEFLSPSAHGINGAKRSFTEHDARILAWVAQMKAQNIALEEIILTLKTAQAANWHHLPPMPGRVASGEPIAVVPREAVEERFSALEERYELQLKAVIQERDHLQRQLQTAQAELQIMRLEGKKYEQELTAVRQNAAEAIQQAQRDTAQTVKELQQRIVELTAQEGELRGNLEVFMIGDRLINPAAMVLLAFMLGAFLALVVLLLARGR